MYGVLTSDPDFDREGVGDLYYITDEVSGTRWEPLDDAINSIACWGDTETVRDELDRAAITATGIRATPDAEGHHWGTVCPNDHDYRTELLERIAAVGAESDVRLTTPGFPGKRFCHCNRCER
jgi:hypothetical protein